jgi:hypothetical protein
MAFAGWDTGFVSHRLRAGLLIILIATVCVGAVWGVAWYRSRALPPAALLKRLPISSALVVYVDFAALRRAGILGRLEGSKIAQDPEYQTFVRKTDFDYKQDLDTALVAFAPAGKFLLLRGQFDWKSLRAYVESENGTCYNSLCRMQGSTQERRISFFPLQTNLMALAVSQDESAAIRMQDTAPGPVPEMPPETAHAAVWMSIPAEFLRSSDLPEGTRPFAQGMERAESVFVAFAPEGKRVAAKLNVRCRSTQDAADLAAQLSRTTALLREMLERDRRPLDPAGLSGVLAAGTFRSEGIRVFGYWPIEPAFLDSVLGGS